MLRIIGKTGVLVTTLYAALSCSLLNAPAVLGEETEASEPSEMATPETAIECPAPKVTASTRARPVRCRGTGLLNRPQVINCRPRGYGQPELFHDYYVPGACGGVPANLYPAPHRVPPVVGQTYYTYQPFMPHEQLYQHRRTYYRYYNGGRGLTRTSVSWYRPPFSGWYSNLRLAR